MKRWAVFNVVTYYPSGGMGDFRCAFDTKAEAEAYIASRVDLNDAFVEDMEDFLTQPSPAPWSTGEIGDYWQKLAEARERAMQDPLGRVMINMADQLRRDMFGDGSGESNEMPGLEAWQKKPE